MLQKLGLKEDEAIVHPWINKALEKAQQKVEARNFDIRKNLLKFDDVMNDQRKVIFEQRIDLMGDEAVDETVADMRHEVIDDLVAKHIPGEGLSRAVGRHRPRRGGARRSSPSICRSRTGRRKRASPTRRCASASSAGRRRMAGKVAEWGPDVMRQVEKAVLLQTLDHLWREHLVMLEHLRQVIGFRGYAQRDPLNEYKTEAFSLFEAMLARLREAVTGQLMRVEIVQQPPPPMRPPQQTSAHGGAQSIRSTGEDEMALAAAPLAPALVGNGNGRASPGRRNPKNPATWGKVGRNEPCPCGSGKKYKHCHGKFA